MDPLSALSVAGNIIQFIQFGMHILSKGQEIYRSSDGLLAEACDLGVISQDVKTTTHSFKASLHSQPNFLTHESANKHIEITTAGQELEVLSRKLKFSLHGRKSLNADEDDQALNAICDSCIKAADELSAHLEKLKFNGERYRRWKSIRQALKTVWQKEDIENLVKRLSLFRGQLEFHILASLRKQQTRAAIVEDGRFKLLQERTQNIITFVLENRNSFEDQFKHRTQNLEDASNIQHEITRSVVINTFSDMRDEIQKSDRAYSTLFETLLGLKENIRTVDEINHDVEDQLLQALKFPKMEERHEEISEAHRHTFDWILRRTQPKDKPWSNFSEWLRYGTGVYWVNGKAASGKSTLMRHVFDNLETKEALLEWAQGQRLQTAGFFFWSSGTIEQRSHKGILQSLLYQTLSMRKELIRQVFPEKWDDLFSQCARYTRTPNISHSDYDTTWSLSNLQQAFMQMKNMLASSKMCLFIDGLDEYDGDHEEMAQFLIDIANSPSIKVCVSSRPWVIFEDAFKKFPTLRLQDLTYMDIVRYVEERLQSSERWVQLEQNETKNAVALKNELVTMASGIFLWVKLVVRSLLSGLSNHDEVSDLSKRLRLLPRDLEELYDHMLTTVDPVYLEEASKIFQLLRIEREAQEQATHIATLDLLTLSLADEKLSEAVFNNFKPTNEEIMTHCQRTEDRLKTRCAGLLEVGISSSEGYWHQNVNYMHRTVKDFLERPDIWAKVVKHTSSYESHLAVYLLQSTILYLKMHFENSSLMPSKQDWQLIQLAMIYGCMADTQPGKRLEKLLDQLDTIVSEVQNKYDPYSNFHWSSERILQGPDVDYESCSTFLSFTIQYGISSFIRSKIYQDPTIIKKKHGRPLLDYAICPNNTISNIPHRPEIVNLLLDYGASPNEVFKNITPWKSALFHLAVQHSQEIIDTHERSGKKPTMKLLDWVEIMASLVTHGADPKAYISFENGSKARHKLPAADIINHAFSRQFPIQATDIKRILIARGLERNATKKGVSSPKRQSYHSKPAGRRKNLGVVSSRGQINCESDDTELVSKPSIHWAGSLTSNVNMSNCLTITTGTRRDTTSSKSKITSSNPELEPLLPKSNDSIDQEASDVSAGNQEAIKFYKIQGFLKGFLCCGRLRKKT